MTSRWLNAFTMLLLGVLATAGYAPIKFLPASILAIGAAWISSQHQSPTHAGLLGWWFGLGYFLTGTYWLVVSMHVYGHVPTTLAALYLCGFCALLALYKVLLFGLSSWLSQYFPRLSPLIFCLIWAGIEMLRAYLFTGFPWLLQGVSVVNTDYAGLAPILGLYGCSAVLVLTACLAVRAMLNQKRTDLIGLGVVLVISLGLNHYGLVHQWTHPVGKPLKIALVQGNIPQTIKWNPAHRQRIFDRYIQLSAPLWHHHDLIVWPEAAIPAVNRQVQPLLNSLNTLATQTQTQLLSGIIHQASNNQAYHNSAVLIGHGIRYVHKHHLVPFGEYTPNWTWLQRFMQNFNLPMSNFEAGALPESALKIHHQPVGVSICYEVAYPDHLTEHPATLLVTISDDSWFGQTTAADQHLQIAQFAALANQKPMMFSTNTGVSALIDHHGHLIRSLPMNQTGVITSTLQPRI